MVLDTNVVVSALLWNGAPRRLLRAAAVAGVELFTSDPLLAELAERPFSQQIQKETWGLGVSSSELFGTYPRQVAIVQATSAPRIAPDPDDDVVIGTAFAAKADLVVTGDRALLSVAKYEGVRIVSVREALDAIVQGVSQDAP